MPFMPFCHLIASSWHIIQIGTVIVIYISESQMIKASITKDNNN